MDSKEIFCLIIIIFLVLIIIGICNEDRKEEIENYTIEAVSSNTVNNEIENTVPVDSKNYSKDMKISYTNDKTSFVYMNTTNQNDYTWNDYIVEDIEILKDMPEIDFSKFEELEDEFYALKITDYSVYKEYFQNYNLKELKEEDFDNIFAEIIIRKNIKNAIKYNDIIKGYEYVTSTDNYRFPVTTGGRLNADKNLEYPGIVCYFPNYMNEKYSNLYFNVIVQGENIKVSKEKALEIAQNYLKDLKYERCSNFSDMDYIRLDNVYGNDFIDTEDKEKPVVDQSKKYLVWSISAYSKDDVCTWANVYVDTISGKIIGGILNYATD